MSSVLFGGSRSLPPSALPLVRAVVGAWLASGGLVSVGCAVGADLLVLSSVPAGLASRLRVFASFSACGAGAWRGSAVAPVLACARAGVSVSFLAGGSLAVPLIARLMGRSVAALAGCSAAVFFSPGPGSLKVAGVAVARGLPVFAFGACPAGRPRGAAGQWVAASWCGLSCWAWSPAAVQPGLL